jgi:hypothetical protein
MSAGPRCWIDLKVINNGQEAAKRVEWWRQADGQELLFSDGVSDAAGKLSEATGSLVKAAHSKCYWAARRSAERQPDALANTDEGEAQ